MIGKTIGSVLSSKEIQGLVAVQSNAMVSEAVTAMCQRGVGAVLVREAGGNVEGIFTERDVVRRVVDERRDPHATPMSDVMSRNVRHVAASASIEEALRLMIVHRYRHLLVEDSGEVKGLVSIRDLMYWMVLPDEPIAYEGRVGVIRARIDDAERTIQSIKNEGGPR
jgi:CBS domain-containing protein